MTRWTIDSPTALDFDGVVALRVRIIAGSVAVLATADRPRLEVAEISGQPLLVTHEAGILTITYEDLSWDGLLGWLRPQRHSANITVMVAKDCPAQIGVVNATAVVAGMSAKTSLKSVNGDITLDGVTGVVDANTVSGNVETEGLDGDVAFHSVSGDLTLADGCVRRLDARTVSGRLTADVELGSGNEVRVGTLSGDVAIRLPGAASTKVDLRSASGSLNSEFDGLSGSPRTLSGTLGDGSGRLSVNTMSGNVTILQRSPRADRTDRTGHTDHADHADHAEEAATAGGGTTVEGDA
jgi:Putative adhesin